MRKLCTLALFMLIIASFVIVPTEEVDARVRVVRRTTSTRRYVKGHRRYTVRTTRTRYRVTTRRRYRKNRRVYRRRVYRRRVVRTRRVIRHHRRR